MKKFKKRWLSLSLCMFSLFVAQTSFGYWVELVHDGNLIQKTKIVKFNGVEYILLKSIATLFKGKIQWYPIAGKVVLQLKNKKITFDVNSHQVSIGNKKVTLSAPSQLIKRNLFVPIDFFLTPDFAEIVDCRIDWNPSNPTLTAEPRVSLFSPRIYQRSNVTRIAIEFTEEIKSEIKKKDGMILVEIPKARISSEENIQLNNGVIQYLKTTKTRRGVLLKISLASGVTSYSSFQEKDPNRLIIEIVDPHGSPFFEGEKLTEVKPPETKSSSTETLVSQPTLPPPRIPSRVKKIVLDAGHGGKDPGAIGPLGTKEKDINLLIVLELARLLSIEGGYEVFLTRSDDQFVSLIDRTLFANEKQADLFISIHCNASLKKSQGGFEIYFLSEEASDPHAELTSKFENAVVELEDPDSLQKQKIQELLFSMVQTEFINESSLLCHRIARAVKKRVPIENRGVKQANFHVLHGAQMASVLVETAFLTHPQEEQKLRQRKIRSAFVDAILTGIEDYQRELQRL